MIKEGQQKKAKYWGNFKVKKVAQLKQPIECHSEDIGTALFEPTIVKIEWEKSPSADKHEFWFPYWITTGGKQKYGQFAPMMGERSFLELLQSAMVEDFFSEGFLKSLGQAISEKLQSRDYNSSN
jgi:hypothetical protein